jgi:hypothetical protein
MAGLDSWIIRFLDRVFYLEEAVGLKCWAEASYSSLWNESVPLRVASIAITIMKNVIKFLRSTKWR